MLTLILVLAAQGAQPSFACDRARTQIEHLVCGSANLAALDREEARLYRALLAAAPAERARIVARQRRFLRDREACVGSSVGTETCVHDTYLEDIADMRRTWPAAFRGLDPDGVSAAPVRYHCDGGFPDAWVTAFELGPPEILVQVHTTLDEAMVLVGDGDHYVGRDDNMDAFDAHAGRLRIGRRICTPAR